jgi:selT/selW/selH-like putative selenoprotein
LHAHVARARTPDAACATRARRAAQYRAIKQAIEARFPGAALTITGEGTPAATGYLEVQIVGGPLLHSKKNGGGYVDTTAKMEAMCALRPCAARALRAGARVAGGANASTCTHRN